MKVIDINCDLGEGSTIEDCKKDVLLMPYISSCSIACDGHAGNELTIRESIRNAKKTSFKNWRTSGLSRQTKFWS